MKKKENKLVLVLMAAFVLAGIIHFLVLAEPFYRNYIYPIYNNAAEKEAAMIIPFAKEHNWEKLYEKGWIVGFGPSTQFNVIYQSSGSLDETAQQVKQYFEENGYTMFAEQLTCNSSRCEWPDGKKQNEGSAYWRLEGGRTTIFVSDKNYFNRRTWRTENIPPGKVVINLTFESD